MLNKKYSFCLGIAAICYWAVGWALAYGAPINETLGLFIGQSEFLLIGTTHYAQWVRYNVKSYITMKF